MRRHLLIFLIFSCLLASAQLIQVPIAPSVIGQKKSKSNARTQEALEPMRLPFWDDFSFRQNPYSPNDTLWLFGQSVWVSDGRAINPPSIYAATFDGLDSLGRPYDLINVLAKGFADKLESRPIRLDGLRPAQKDSVYLSFFYQSTGFGEAPDLDDNLSLWFKDENGSWEKVFELANSVELKTDSFYYALVKVESKFQHANFQFRFQNFARLSGSYDTWNLDYVYLNANRWAKDHIYPDRTQVKPFSSILEKYRAMPFKHYKDTASTITIPPIATFFNLYDSSSVEFQPSRYFSSGEIRTWKANISSKKEFLIENDTILGGLPRYAFKDVPLLKTFPIDSINRTADSIKLKFKLWFDSGDEKIIAGVSYRFKPINFQMNDTTHSTFLLTDHYAYDDGIAEYGAGLNEIGDEMAYGFPMFTKEQDTLIKVKIYFPKFGTTSNRTVILKVWNATPEGEPGDELYQESIPVQQTPFNEFVTRQLAPAIIVKDKFFIGWQQTSIGILPVGLDKNNDSGDEIYFKIGDSWQQNQNVRGSLMIRPIFGTGDTGVISGLAEETPSIYPNPSQGQFYIVGKAEILSIHNILGAEQQHEVSLEESRTKVTMLSQATGLYLIRWRQDGNIHTSRLLFLNN